MRGCIGIVALFALCALLSGCRSSVGTGGAGGSARPADSTSSAQPVPPAPVAVRPNTPAPASTPAPAPVPGGGIAKSTAPSGRGPLQVLFVGNSYTVNAVYSVPDVLEELAAKEARPLVADDSGVVGATTLQDHWETTGARQHIGAKRWDYVVLQEQSLRPIRNPELLTQYGALLAGEAKTVGAQPVFYLTWARKATPDTQDQITSAYRAVAAQCGTRVAPVGEAFRAVIRNHPGIELFVEDGSHAGPHGTYLSACTIYATLYGKSPVGLPSRVANLDIAAADAAVLQRAAWDATAAYR